MKKCFLVVVCLFVSNLLNAQWSSQTSPVSTSFLAVKFFDSNNGWAIGSSGSVKTTDGGITWLSHGTSPGPKKVSIVDQNTAFALVGEKGVYATTNGGTSWAVKTSPWITSVGAISFVSSTTGYVGGSNGYIFKTTNSGTSWTEISGGYFYISDLYFLDDQNGWACRWGGQVTRILNGTTTTSTIGTNDFISIFASDMSTAYAAGYNGDLYKTSNGGMNWIKLSTGVGVNLNDVFAVGDEVWAAGQSGLILYSSDGGSTFTVQPGGTSSGLSALYFTDAYTGWACGETGTILKYENTPPSISLDNPAGGEILIAGSAQNIQWTSAGISNVKIEYSTNDGLNWETIISSAPADESIYSWTVPNTPSTQCKIRISDAANPSINDVIEGNFTILGITLTLTSPNGGENWQRRSIHNITWTTAGVENVKLEYTTTDGADWFQITASTPASAGSYAWTVPNIITTNCKLRISDASNADLNDESNSAFTISSIIMGSPNGGEIWNKGTHHDIAWISTNINFSLARLEYSTDNGNTWNLITASADADYGHYIWRVPDVSSTQCLVRVSNAADPGYNDVSNNVFTITNNPQVITITSPNGGEHCCSIF